MIFPREVRNSSPLTGGAILLRCTGWDTKQKVTAFFLAEVTACYVLLSQMSSYTAFVVDGSLGTSAHATVVVRPVPGGSSRQR